MLTPTTPSSRRERDGGKLCAGFRCAEGDRAPGEGPHRWCCKQTPQGPTARGRKGLHRTPFPPHLQMRGCWHPDLSCSAATCTATRMLVLRPGRPAEQGSSWGPAPPPGQADLSVLQEDQDLGRLHGSVPGFYPVMVLVPPPPGPLQALCKVSPFCLQDNECSNS